MEKSIIPPLCDASSLSADELFSSSKKKVSPVRKYDKDSYRKLKLSRCPNPNSSFVFLNTETGQRIPIPCGKYSCPVCGVKKIQRLYSALKNYFSQFKYIRLWTFTLSSAWFANRDEHYRALGECWRRFMTEVRRSKSLNKSQRNVQYVRVCEPHNLDDNRFHLLPGNPEFRYKLDPDNDFFHLHCLFTEWIEIWWVGPTWEHICQEFLKTDIHVAGCKVIGMQTSSSAAHYVCKYVSKNAEVMSSRQKKWTKSSRVSIFVKKESTGLWVFVSLETDLFAWLSWRRFAADFTWNNTQTTSQNSSSNSPPDSIFRPFEHDFLQISSGIENHSKFNLLEFSLNPELKSSKIVLEYLAHNVDGITFADLDSFSVDLNNFKLVEKDPF